MTKKKLFSLKCRGNELMPALIFPVFTVQKKFKIRIAVVSVEVIGTN